MGAKTSSHTTESIGLQRTYGTLPGDPEQEVPVPVVSDEKREIFENFEYLTDQDLIKNYDVNKIMNIITTLREMDGFIFMFDDVLKQFGIIPSGIKKILTLGEFRLKESGVRTHFESEPNKLYIIELIKNFVTDREFVMNYPNTYKCLTCLGLSCLPCFKLKPFKSSQNKKSKTVRKIKKSQKKSYRKVKKSVKSIKKRNIKH